jgi:hypothetical protein
MKTLTRMCKTVSALMCFLCANALAVNGPETAQLLNNRYKNTAATCPVDNPAWQCSGVLLKASARGTDKQFWEHGALATALGAEGLVYLRADLGIKTLTQPNAVVFSDLFSAIGDGKSLDVLCAYPFTPGLESGRSDSGCGLLGTRLQAAGPDISACSALGVTDTPTWLENFAQQDNQPPRQCSLSSVAADQFSASLRAHEGLGSEWSAKTNELLVSNWNANAPQTIPVQALVYDIHQQGALLAALKDQQAWFSATGQWLPVLRMNLNEDPDKVFGFNLQDQIYIGYNTAAAMNARFQDTAPACRDQPAFYCNGVLIRAAEATTAFHAWNPSQNSIARNGVSFSYVRADEGTTTLASTHGFTMKESFAPALHPITLRCAYPTNASTSAIPDSCRTSCEEQNVLTVEAWRLKYIGSPSSSCAFIATPGQFQLHIDVRSVLPTHAREQWNEIIIADWGQNIPTEIPLESFFYTSSAGLPHAQFIQNDYFTTTQGYLPVIKATLTQSAPFSFDPAEQLHAGRPQPARRAEND